MKKYLSLGDTVVIIITFLLFAAALFVKGFTNALLLEAGVLLVSIKIIMMNYKLGLSSQKILDKLADLEKRLEEQEK